MEKRTIALTYCIDNLPTAEQIDGALKASNLEFRHFYCKKNRAETPIPDQLDEFNGPILLLISDNFLKSIYCMHRALQFLQQKGPQILPVVIDGRRQDEETGQWIDAPTKFEKIGDIIPYINYWQNQYLDLRSQRKRMEAEADFDKEALSDHLRILRQVSSEASEFLRVLRNMPYLKYEDLTQDHFKALFEFLHEEEEWEAFQAKIPTLILPQTEALTSPDTYLTDDDEDDFIAGEPESEPESDAETEAEHFDISGIPGLDQLEGSETIVRIISSSQKRANRSEEEEHKASAEPEQPGEPETPEVSTEQPEEVFSPEPNFPETPAPIQQETPEEEPSLEQHVHDIEFTTDILQQAYEMINAGNIQDGLNYLRQATEQFPDEFRLRYHYALLLAQDGSDMEASEAQLHRILESEPDHPEANFLLGELCELKGDFRGAQNHYLRTAESVPDYPEVYYRLGVVTQQVEPEAYEKTARFFKQAYKRNERNADALYRFALLKGEKLGKPRKAIKYLKKTLELEPQHPFANYDLALMYFHEDDRQMARRYYLEAIRINPELQTEENDQAFRADQPETPASVEGKADQETIHTPLIPEEETDTIDSLKARIEKLEQLLARQQEAAIPQVDQTVLISGATSGIGKATATLFARHGYRVIITGRRAERLNALRAALNRDYPGEVRSLTFDVSDNQAVNEALRQLEGKWCDIDILINNAGKAKGLAPIHEGNLDHWNEMIDVNLKGLLYLTRAVTPGMVARQSGHIINLSSTAGKEVYPSGNVYCATKHAVEALTQGMRIDLHQYNIRVSQVSPGHVEDTEFALVRFDGNADKARIYEDFRPTNAYDIAEAIFFIASRPAHVNIQDIYLMGTQQASATAIHRSGRGRFEEEEE